MRAVVSFGIGAWYPLGVARLMASLREHGMGEPGKFHGWIDDYPPGAPGELNVKAGKPFAMKYAIDHGATSVLWLDASAWALSSLGPLFDIIERDGYLLVDHNCSCRGWCCDSTLKTLGLTGWRDLDAIPMTLGAVVGVDVRHEVARRFLAHWAAIADAATPRVLPSGRVSLDPQFQAHRWQVTQSVIAYRHGMQLSQRKALPITWSPESPGSACLALKGM